MLLNHPPTKSYPRLPLKGARVVWLGVWVLLRLAPPDLTFLSDRQSSEPPLTKPPGATTGVCAGHGAEWHDGENKFGVVW